MALTETKTETHGRLEGAPLLPLFLFGGYTVENDFVPEFETRYAAFEGRTLAGLCFSLFSSGTLRSF